MHAGRLCSKVYKYQKRAPNNIKTFRGAIENVCYHGNNVVMPMFNPPPYCIFYIDYNALPGLMYVKRSKSVVIVH